MRSATARPMWSGSISFGLVNIPVRLYPAAREQRVQFHLLTKKGHSRVQRKYVSSADDKEVRSDELVRGFEVSPSQYVVVDDKELEALVPKESRTIELTQFVDLESIDPLFYDRPYYLAPGERAAKPYRLLVEAMKKTGKVGVATFVMRQKEYLAALRAIDNVICLYTMRFVDEVLPIANVPGIDDDVAVSDKEVKMATELIASLAGEFEPTEHHDRYRQQVEQMIEKKAKGDDIITQPEPQERPHRVINLMDALQQSLNEARKSRRRIGHNGNGHAHVAEPRRRKSA